MIVEKCQIWTEESALEDPRSVSPRGVRNPLHYTLGERLKKARIAANILPAHLSRAVGLSVNSVAAIERGRVPGCDVVEKLARGLKVSPCALAYGVAVLFVEVAADAPLRCLGLGERLRGARELAGLSKNALGIIAETTGQTVANIEGGHVPSIAVAEALAAALRISPCWLAFGESDPSGPRFPPPIKKKKPPTAPRRVRAPRKRR